MITGQILPDSPFGKELTRLAHHSKTIVEIGTWRGGGSTLCLASGLLPDATMYTVEGDSKMYLEFINEGLRQLPNFRQIIPHYGVIQRGILPLQVHPPTDSQTQLRECWEEEKMDTRLAPIIRLDFPIDLLLLDGGAFTSLGDFLHLWPQVTKWIALDDTNPTKSCKNVFAYAGLTLAGWDCIQDEQDDRNGWTIFQKP